MSEKRYSQYGWSKWSDLKKLQNFVTLDVETTGLDPKTQKIIEIALIKVIDGSVQDEYSSLVCPRKPLSARITKLTGITDADLSEAPVFQEIAETVADFIGDLVVVGHNVTFDLSFITSELSEAGIDSHFTYVDTLQIARKAYPDLEDHKLETLISELDLSDKQTHRAMDDAQCTLKLFRKAVEKYSHPLVSIVASCCSPISAYRFELREAPLQGLSFATLGNFTFSHSDMKKLISAAGGTLVSRAGNSADYLVLGYLEPYDRTAEYEGIIKLASDVRACDGTPRIINEVALLKLCGVSFYDEVVSNE